MEIKNHIFFSPINWDDLINKKITPPFNPNVVRITSNYRVHGECVFTPCLCGMPRSQGQVARWVYLGNGTFLPLYLFKQIEKQVVIDFLVMIHLNLAGFFVVSHASFAWQF